jgi:DHA1 family inner membrane transport protein
MLKEVTGLDPIAVVPIFLLIGGAGAVTGIWLGGRAADWNRDRTILIVLAGQIVCFILLLFAIYNPVATAIMLFLSSAFGFGFSTPVQVRILHAAREAPRLAATMISTAYNIGIAIGAAVGAALLTAGVGYALLPVTGIVCSGIALVIAAGSLAYAQRNPA